MIATSRTAAQDLASAEASTVVVYLAGGPQGKDRRPSWGELGLVALEDTPFSRARRGAIHARSTGALEVFGQEEQFAIRSAIRLWGRRIFALESTLSRHAMPCLNERPSV